MSVDVRPVRGARDRSRFIDLPFRLFGHDPSWVPPLRLSVRDRISPKYPANEHQDTQLWLAHRDGRVVGRIGACVDALFNDYQRLAWCWVGFFESIDDPDVATALFQTAWQWARTRDVRTCVGPASFTTNDECGLLVEGFEHPPMVLTPQNPPYYERLWVDAGWSQAMDLWAWRFDREKIELSDRQRRILERLRTRADVRVRGMRMKEFDAEVDRFLAVYNSAWSRNWGFAPLTEAEIRHLAKALKQIIDPDLALLVERSNGEPVGVCLTLPDVNVGMRRVRSGRLLPLGWWHLLRAARHSKQARVWALGARPDVQSRAIGLLLYAEIVDRLREKGTALAEASWILATNTAMNSAIEAMGATRYKTWRLYEHPLG
jgi:ribosomal protein S18 acetylase RimI-like enzyme